MVDDESVSCADLQDWATEFEALTDRVGSLFAHPKSRAHSRQYLEGLLAPIERKNGWTIDALMFVKVSLVSVFGREAG